MRWIPRRIGVKMAAAAAVALASVATLGVPAAVAGTNAGSATITNPSNGQPLNSGGSATTWTITLPAQAACSHDTASGFYHVESYIVPSTVDPSTLSFNSAGPTDPTSNQFDYPLYDTTGSAYANANTAPNTGQVVQIPSFNYAIFSINGSNGNALTLPAGTYNVGIACATNTGAEDKFWNVQETFTADGTDPNGEVWSVTPTSAVPESPMNIALPVSAAVVLLGGASIVVWRRRRSDEAPVIE
jgi:hypothetical protein